MLKKNLIVLIAFSLLIAAMLILLPAVFQKSLNAGIRRELKLRYNARIEYHDFNLSFYKDFPRISISLHQLTIIGVDTFAGDTLGAVEDFDLGTDLRSLLKGDKYQVLAVNIIHPKIYAHVNADGIANWNIIKNLQSEEHSAKNQSAADSSRFSLNIRQYQIKNGELKYANEQKHISFETRDLNFSGDANTDGATYDLSAKISAAQVDYKQDSTTYLQQANIESQVQLKMDYNAGKYLLSKSTFCINEICMETDGAVNMANDSIHVDLAFQSKETELKDIITLLHSTELAKLNMTGKISLAGNAKGLLAKNNAPALKLNVQLQNGSLPYSGGITGLKNMFLQATITKLQGTYDSTAIEISKFAFTTNGKSDLNLSGKLAGLIPFLYGQNELKAAIQLQGRLLDLGDWNAKNKSLAVSSSSGASISQSSSTPAKTGSKNFTERLHISTSITGIQKVISDKLLLENVKGNVEFKSGILAINDFTASTCGGAIKANALIATTNKPNTLITLNGEIVNCNIQQTCKELSAEKLSPTLQDIQGSYSAQFKAKFNLKPDWSIDYTTLEGETTIKIPTARVAQIPALTEIARQAKITTLQNLEMTNMVSNIKFGQGRVSLSPTNMKFTNGYSLRLSGWNDFEQHINYDMHLDMPTSSFGNTASLAQNFLSGLGLNITVPKNLGFSFKVSGTFEKPDVQLLKVGE